MTTDEQSVPVLAPGLQMRIRYTDADLATRERLVKILSAPQWTWHGAKKQWVIWVYDRDESCRRAIPLRDLVPLES